MTGVRAVAFTAAGIFVFGLALVAGLAVGFTILAALV